MLSKWFFTKTFAPHSLVVIKIAAANFRNSSLSGKNQNMLVSLLSLNLSFYRNPDWAQQKSTAPYMPYNQVPNKLSYVIKNKQGKETECQMSLTSTSSYSDSIDYDKGWFNPQFLQAIRIGTLQHPTATHQVIAARYNPNIDDGVGNQIYCVSTLASTWDPPKSDKQLLIEGMPLWLGLYGYYNYVKAVKTEDFLRAHVIVLSSKSLYCYPEIGSCTRYVFIDQEYIQGKKPYDQLITTQQKKLWYPDMHWQKKSMNSLIECGPFIPKYAEETYSTWEANCRYSFYFKWGGANTDEPNIKNPEELPTYDVPDSMPKRIQIVNPEKQAPETIIHPWDYRRGIIKEKALKRMCSNIETDTEFQYSPETTPKKKQRLQAALPVPEKKDQEIKACLLSLCEENTYQETQEQNLQQLILQQQQQQQQLKYNMLKLILDLKEKQKILQYHAGVLD